MRVSLGPESVAFFGVSRARHERERARFLEKDSRGKKEGKSEQQSKREEKKSTLTLLREQSFLCLFFRQGKKNNDGGGYHSQTKHTMASSSFPPLKIIGTTFRKRESEARKETTSTSKETSSRRQSIEKKPSIETNKKLGRRFLRLSFLAAPFFMAVSSLAE